MTPEILEHLEAAAQLAWQRTRAAQHASQRRVRRDHATRIERVITHLRITMRPTSTPHATQSPA